MERGRRRSRDARQGIRVVDGRTGARKTGAFFTPFALVDRVTRAGLETALGAHGSAALDGSRVEPARARRDRIAIGRPHDSRSGLRLGRVSRPRARAARGDSRAMRRRREPSARSVATSLTRSIFGVDVNPTAVWLCELRLWLSVVIESDERDPAAVMPLPNLDRNIRVGDSLSGRAFGDDDVRFRGGASLGRLRQRYANANGARKESLGHELDRAERERALLALDTDLATLELRRRDLVVARRGRDLFGARYHPSREERDTARVAAAARCDAASVAPKGSPAAARCRSHSPRISRDVASRGGFGLIVGNPPWVRLHNIPADQRALFRRDYDVARHAAWEPGAGPSGAGRGFAAQLDVAAVFIERATRLLAPAGTLSLLVPAKLWRSLAGGGVRWWIAAETDLAAWRITPALRRCSTPPSTLPSSSRNDVADRISFTATPVRVAVVHHGRDAVLVARVARIDRIRRQRRLAVDSPAARRAQSVRSNSPLWRPARSAPISGVRISA